MKQLFPFAFLALLAWACGNKNSTEGQRGKEDSIPRKGTFGFDIAFLKKHKDVLVLGDSGSGAQIAIIKDYQARVMTSTAIGKTGNSYGWINYELIQSGKSQPHINPLGGEDRFWLGPEGGQYSVFFKKGSSFDFEHWQTPAPVDSEPFDLISANTTEAIFRKSTTLVNYQGFEFNFDINRKIKILNNDAIGHEFGFTSGSLHAVAFESNNAITNTGKKGWTKKTGLLSIWILGMYNPSDKTTIILPYEKSADFTKKVTDNYFGTIPSDRIVESDSLLLLKGDGRYRGKVGIAPAIAKNIAGSYDAGRHILTLVKFDVNKNADYVNSKWELQKEPYRGDVVNSYNDGPLVNGGQLGPFYELESSSPAKELKPGETLEHRHITLHLEGDESLLNEIAWKTLGVSLADIARVFNKK